MTRKSQKKKMIEPEASEQKEGKDTQHLETVAEWLKKVKFKRSLLGGVREEDVWKKIAELNALYERALEAERIRCDTLIEHYRLKPGSGEDRHLETEKQFVLMGKRQ
ncbi:MAG: hypothetical protein PHR78_03755 [Eubacteriales bacterium]|nr:hypothetical protein [Eubacteriales bacterium]MDD4323254.1 hypothetical protein [Eubacteriales bacterium]MDD4541262.1 hypothetical protein [Eubacteriales bacterium]